MWRGVLGSSLLHPPELEVCFQKEEVCVERIGFVPGAHGWPLSTSQGLTTEVGGMESGLERWSGAQSSKYSSLGSSPSFKMELGAAGVALSRRI